MTPFTTIGRVLTSIYVVCASIFMLAMAAGITAMVISEVKTWHSTDKLSLGEQVL